MNLSKISLFFVLLCFVLACSKEDAPTPVAKEALTGTWKVTDIAYAGTSTTTIQGMSFPSDFTGTGYDMDLIVNFEENPNTYTSSGDYSIKVTSTLQGQTMTYNWTNQDFLGGGSWSLSNKELTIEAQTGEKQKATILELNATTLKLGYDMINNTEQNGATVSSNVKGTYTFQRQ
ncbi:hypothetical protein D770_00075 [Flammeovirgaceae bacterium 311]|nr:hypothetical protein D770_00075 [Flammeovirgaceae bacterium 311]